MTNKNRGKSLVIAALFAAVVVYLASRMGSSAEWKRFRSHDFWQSLAAVRPDYVFLGVLLVLTMYLFRALRWQVFLGQGRPGRLRDVLTATLIGFSALTLLGRAGELVRPVLIARKERVSVYSQFGAWALERAFDSLAIAAILGTALVFFPPRNLVGARSADVMKFLRAGGLFLCVIAFVIMTMLALFRSRPQRAAGLLESLLRWLPERIRSNLRLMVEHFLAGFAHMNSASRFLLCGVYSLGVWITLLLTMWSSTRALAGPIHLLGVGDVVVVLMASAAGSIVSLPGIGGGPQLAAILTFTELFGIPLASATTAAILIWFLTGLVVLIPGIPLAAHQGLTWKRLESISEQDPDALAEGIKRSNGLNSAA